MTWPLQGLIVDIVSAPYNAVTGKRTTLQENESILEGQEAIQNVADRANEYYGEGSPTAIAAQQAANYNKPLVAGDVAAVSDSYAQGCSGLNIFGCCIDSYEGFLSCANSGVKIGLAILAGVTGIYLLVLFGPTISNLLERASAKN